MKIKTINIIIPDAVKTFIKNFSIHIFDKKVSKLDEN
jgi:hypothetical protein